jgi:dihydropyrimidinase
MTKPIYDVVVRGGTVGTASGAILADIGVRGGTITAIGQDLPAGAREIDARAKLVLPGGVDSHCHIEQLSAAGIMNADSWESATRSAALGGTTSVIAFAAQHVGMSLARVVDDYAALARRGAVVDYAFHMIVADPTDAALKEDLPALIRAGHASIKVFMTYDRLRIEDEGLLDLLVVARENRALVCAHAENHGMIAWASRRLVERGFTVPKFHAMSHPRLAETEAFERLIRMAALVDQPIMIFHVSTAEGAAIIRRARGEGPQGLRRNLPAIPVHDRRRPRQAGARGGEMDVLAPAPHDGRPGSLVARPLARRPADDLVRSRTLRL